MPSSEVGSNDEDLVRLAVAGDQEAFAELVRRHRDEVYTLALRMVSDPDLAADVSQEALVRAWRALPRFRQDAKFSTWLYRITVNTAITHRSRRTRRRTEALDDLVVHPADEGIAPDDDATDRALADRLEAALRGLPESLRTVVVLKDVYDWTHSDIAEHLGISVTATKVRLHRGRARLRVELDDLGEGR